jgi:hypothetical protein
MANSRKQVINRERALLWICTRPSPPNVQGLCRTISSGFSNWSSNSQDFTQADILERSHILRLIDEVLNHTLLRQYVFKECGLLVTGMNFPPLQGPIVCWTLAWSSSQFTFLVFWKVHKSLTPIISKCRYITI